MKRFDAIIIGGGPAGSTCARALRKAGLAVGLLDSKPFPRDKVCAGWITPEVATSLELDLDHYGRDHVLQPISAFRTGLIDGDIRGWGGSGAPITTDYEKTVSYGIRRCEFDDYLLRRSGAELLLGERVATPQRKNGEWQVNGWRAPLVIGAGGHYCPVARYLGADVGQGEQPVTAQEFEIRLDAHQKAECAIAGDTPELYFCRDLRGYGWCFRKGDWLNVGLGREGRTPLAAHVAGFMAFLQRTRRIPAELLSTRPHGHAYLLYRQPAPRPRSDEGVLLIGDAAGLAAPQSGEGIRPAIESALLAAETVVAAMGDYSRLQLSAYEERLHLHFGPGDEGAEPGLLARWAGRSLLASRIFIRHVVLDRWFLHRHQPALQ